MLNVTYSIVETNGIKMHVAESGKGPLVILCHGFPELWYSWRFQLEALSAIGFRVVAPDQRGYGKTDCPLTVEEYDILKLTGDIVGLVHALGEESATIVGHDWGAPVAWHCALLRPDIFKALVLMSVPYRTRLWGSTRPTEAMAQMAGELQFYQLYFQEVGKAESELQENVRHTMLKLLYSASGDPPPNKRWSFLFDKSQRFIDTGFVPDVLPSWLTNQDIDFFTHEFENTGFRGGLNWYRNADRNWELTSFLIGAKIQLPTLFIAGELDAVITMSRRAFDNLEISVPGLKTKVLIPGAGHWVQQEKPTEVNRLLIEFLTEVSRKRK